MIKKPLPVLVCDICGEEVQTTSASQNYNMKVISMSDLTQSGSGASPYQLYREKSGHCCNSCYVVMVKESPTLQKFFNNTDRGR